MNIKRVKDLVIGGFVGAVLVGGITTASTLITENVYSNPYPILFNGNEYKASMPLLNYQERTYVPLRELATLTGSHVDFKNDTIIINDDNESENKYIGKWYLQEDNDSYIDIKEIEENELTFELFFFRTAGIDNAKAYINEKNVYEFINEDTNLGPKSKGIITLEEDKIVVNIYETELDYIKGTHTYIDKNNLNKSAIALSKIKKCLLDNKWLKENVYMKENCFGESISLESQQLSFNVIYNENMPTAMVKAYSYSEEGEQLNWGVQLFAVYYDNGRIISKPMYEHPMHPAHTDFYINTNNNTVSSLYQHMGAIELKQYMFGKNFVELNDFLHYDGDSTTEAYSRINGEEVSYQVFKQQYDNIVNTSSSYINLNYNNINKILN